MSNVFIPLGGAGGKNRGEGVQVDENYTYLKLGDSGVRMPLPAGNYKAMKAEHGEENPFASYGDGKNAIVFMTKDFLKKVTIDLFEIASITNFSLSMYAHRQVRLTWAVPSEGLWSGVRFVFKYGSMPTSETDGFMVYDSADVHYETPKLEERELFVRAFNYVTVKDGRWYDEGAVSARITVTGISGSVTLSTGAGVWTVPDNVYKIRYILVGHGGKGGPGNGYAVPGGGGGGGYFNSGYMNVTPGQRFNWIIPSIPYITDGIVPTEVRNYESGVRLPQYDTVFGNIRADYGFPPPERKCYTSKSGKTFGQWASGGNGGSGGAAFGGSPGTNGNDGSGVMPNSSTSSGRTSETVSIDLSPGVGQHTSTTGFNGVLYSSGGLSGVIAQANVGVNGADGLGNGGGGANHPQSKYAAGCIGGKGGTGCIYIAWGSLMNDGS